MPTSSEVREATQRLLALGSPHDRQETSGSVAEAEAVSAAIVTVLAGLSDRDMVFDFLDNFLIPELLFQTLVPLGARASHCGCGAPVFLVPRSDGKVAILNVNGAAHSPPVDVMDIFMREGLSDSRASHAHAVTQEAMAEAMRALKKNAG